MTLPDDRWSEQRHISNSQGSSQSLYCITPSSLMSAGLNSAIYQRAKAAASLFAHYAKQPDDRWSEQRHIANGQGSSQSLCALRQAA